MSAPILPDNNRRLSQRKVYALFLESNKTFFLSIQSAFSLEEASDLARKEFAEMSPIKRGINTLDNSKIGMFAIKTLEELADMKDPGEGSNRNQITVESSPKGLGLEGMAEFFEKEADYYKDKEVELREKLEKRGRKYESIVPAKIAPVELSEKEAKNLIMQQIVRERNLELFEQNKDLFTKAECEYLKKRLE